MQRLQPRFHLLTGPADFPEMNSPDVVWDRHRAGLTLRPYLAPPDDRPDLPLPPPRHGAERDRSGNWYWISEDGTEICILTPGEKAPRRIRPGLPGSVGRQEGDHFQDLWPEPLMRLSGLAMIEGEYLVVGTVSRNGLLLLDLLSGSAFVRSFRPLDLVPLDLARAPAGGIYVLSRQPEPAYIQLDRHLRPVSGPWPLPAIDPVALEPLPDGSVLILEDGRPATIHRFWQATWLREFRLELPAHFSEREQPYPIAASDLAFRTEPDLPRGAVSGTLFVAAPQVRQAFAFSFSARAGEMEVQPEVAYYPLDVGSRELAVADGEVYSLTGSAWRPLQQQPRTRYKEDGALLTDPLDGKEPNCTWHRLLLDAVIPPGTSITVLSRHSDDLNLLQQQRWDRQPPLYLRPGGSELPYFQPFPGKEAHLVGAGTWELLLQQTKGRFLQIRLILAGTGFATPLIRAVRVYYPRFSYALYLPQAYRQEKHSFSFLERYLANPEGILTALGGQISQAHSLFDPRTAPPEFLDWLASWFGVMLDRSWEPVRRRLFIAHAMVLFRSRGTVPGLVRAIRLATDPQPTEAIFTDPVGPYTGDAEGLDAHAGAAFRILEGHAARGAPEIAGEDQQGVIQPDFSIRRAFLEFLRHRYHRIERFNEEHGLTGSRAFPDFHAVPFDWRLKEQLRAEWERFQTRYLDRVRGAHQFTVLVATTPDGAAQLDLDLVRQVVEMEKPAHTHFELKANAMAFNVGLARLGMDTVLGDAGQFDAVTLGHDLLAHGYLAAHPGEAGSELELPSPREERPAGDFKDRGRRA